MYIPQIGEKLYLQQRTGNFYVDEVKRPYTVVGVAPGKITIQEALCVFNGPRYYDTLPDDIVEDKNGQIKVLHWARMKNMWQTDSDYGYPKFAHWGEGYQYYPYLN